MESAAIGGKAAIGRFTFCVTKSKWVMNRPIKEKKNTNQEERSEIFNAETAMIKGKATSPEPRIINLSPGFTLSNLSK